MITFEEYGVPLTQQMGTMADDKLIKSEENSYKIRIYKMAFDSGMDTYEPVLGDLILGATSAATGIVLAVEDTSGSAGSVVGNIYMYNVSGTWANDEVFNVVKATDGTAVADEGTVNLLANYYDNARSFKSPAGITIFNGMEAKAAILEAYANPLRVSIDGTPCTSTTLTNGLVSRGIYLENGNVLIIRGKIPVRNLRFCNATASSNAQYRVIYFF